MEELATVTTISHDCLTVVSQIKSTCNSCSQVDNCANGQVAKAIPHKKLSFTLRKPVLLNNQTIVVGDSVVLAVPEEDIMRSAWQVYLLPMLGLFLFSAFGQWLVQKAFLPHELIAIVIGGVGGYLGYRLAKKLQSNPIVQKNLQPKILRVLPKAIAVNNISES